MIIGSKFKGWCLTALAAAGAFAAGCGDDGNTAKDAATPKDSGTDAFVPQPAAISIAPLTADFATVTVGQSSAVTTFTIANAGPGASDQVQVNLSGNADYHVTANTCATLAAGANCTVGITYSPTAQGATTATLLASVTGSSATAMIKGSGGNPNGLAIAPATFSFANAIIGTPGTDSDTITVTNNGSAATAALTVQATGDATQFTKSADTCNGQTVAAGATCTLTVKFTPTTAGQKAAGYTVINGTSSVSAGVTGLAATAAALAIAPPTQNFGSVVQGTTSSTVSINVANIGGSTTGAITAAVSGTDAAAFAIVTNTCTTLAASATCQLTLRFTPAKLGAAAATLTVSGTPGGSVTTSLNGTGITTGGLTLDPTTFGFATTQVGATSSANTFTVTNSGGTAIGPIVINFSGADANQFRDVGGADTCTAATLQPAGKCTFQINFAPESVGNKSASVIVSASGVSVTAALTGAGTPPPQLAITPNSQNFGSVGVGDTASPLSFTITNIGGAATSVPAITLTGTNASQFAQTNNCTAALAPLTGTCTVAVTFTPTAVGAATATITAAAATGGTVSASVFGQGNNPAQLSVIPGNLAFSTTVGDPTSQSFTVQNNGSTATGPIAISISGTGLGTTDFMQSGTTCTSLAAGATCSVTITYSPTVASADAVATITATPGGTTTVALAGTSVPRLQQIGLSNPYDFGTQAVGAYICQSYNVRNNTSSTQTVTETDTYDTDGPYPAGSFSFSSSCHGASLAPGNSCFESVCFTPASVGQKKASINYSIGAGDANQLTVSLKGNGIQTITLTPESTADFGNVTINKTSPQLAFRVTNITNGAITFKPVNTPNVSAINAPFNATQGSCTGPLNPGQFCDLFVTFSPTTLGPFVSTLTVVATSDSSHLGGTAQIDVHGTGVDASSLQLTPTTLDFGSVPSGATPVVKTIVIQNPAGSQTSGPLLFTLTGASEFSQLTNLATDCHNGDTIPNGTSCDVRIQYAPTDEVGTNVLQTAQINVKANPGALGSGTSATLSGTTSSAITITPTTYSFGVVQPPSTATHDFVIKNVTAATVTFDTFGFVGGTTTDLTFTKTCGATLAAGASCTVTVKFAPAANGTTDSTTLVAALTAGQGHANATITAASSDILYSHLTDVYPGDAYQSSVPPYAPYQVADDIVVPAGGWTLTSIDAVFWFNPGSTPSADKFTLKIYNDASGLPGTVVGTYANLGFTLVQDQSGTNQVGYTQWLINFPVPSIPLATAGRYWISLFDTSEITYWGGSTVKVGDNVVQSNTCSAWSTIVSCGNANFQDALMAVHGSTGATPGALPAVPQLVYPQPQFDANAYRKHGSSARSSLR